jgi:hypothetical protein
MTKYLVAFAFNNLKKSWKSRGNGIISVGTLAQQFQPFKPLYRRLAQPVASGSRVITQIHNGNRLPLNARGFGQWRYHDGETIAKSGAD